MNHKLLRKEFSKSKRFSKSNADLLREISSVEGIVKEMDHIVKNCDKLPIPFFEEQGFTLANLMLNKEGAAKEISLALENGTWAFKTVRFRERANKLHPTIALRDLIVMQRLSWHLKNAIKNKLYIFCTSECDINAQRFILRRFTKFLHSHFKDKWEKDRKGLFCLKIFGQDWTERVPLHEDSYVWSDIAAMLNKKNQERKTKILDLIKTMGRPAEQLSGCLYSRIIGGLPQSPMSTIIERVGLAKIDNVLKMDEQGWYMRMGNNAIILHPNPLEVEKKKQQLKDVLEEFNLQTRNLSFQYFTPSNLPSPLRNKTPTTAYITFKGIRYDLQGNSSLPKRREEALIYNIQKNLQQQAKDLPKEIDLAEKGKKLTVVLNELLNSGSRSQIRIAEDLIQFVNNKEYLHEVDIEIAKLLAHVVTGKPGNIALRECKYSQVKKSWGFTPFSWRKEQTKFSSPRRGGCNVVNSQEA